MRKLGKRRNLKLLSRKLDRNGALLSQKLDKISFLNRPPAQSVREVSLQGQGGPCGKRAAFSMRGNLARSSGPGKSCLT